MADTEDKDSKQSVNITNTRELLGATKVDPDEALDLVKKLKSEDRAFGYAVKLLRHTLNNPATKIEAELEKKLNQQLALCTYKDPDLPPELRLDNAFNILNESDPLVQTRDQETLGIAGAIYKRKWEQGNNKLHLERSLVYYQRGYQRCLDDGWHVDQGYNAINAAYVLDLLGFLEQKEMLEANGSSTHAEQRFKQADSIRKDIVVNVSALLDNSQYGWMKQTWWVLVTLGEACFALAKYKQSRNWLMQAEALDNVPDWERESTARQLASILKLRSNPAQSTTAKNTEAEQVLTEFLGSDVAVMSVMSGKIGLALSGGGFRASLYHIGVLARLAELDLLRHIEVISCVSGGSIIGAHYYLEVRHLLQTNTQDKIKKDNYIAIVKKIEKSFLAGVQSNIRIRILTSLKATLKMLFSAHYSRTKRLGELYEEQIYSRIKDGLEGKDRYLNDLIIKPLGEDENFRPKDHNWHRSAKVPILVLNATSLNTGHNWQFTASWMGEPPAGIDTEIDANYRLRRMYYKDAPDNYKKIRLGDAVAASSCVPGLFEPLAMPDLYPDITLRLVDGGVYDNQGTAGLLDQGCNVLLVSDASGQMSEEDQPGIGLLDVPLRTSSILQTRVRSAQYHELDARLRSGLLQGMMYIHMKKGLQGGLKDWNDCEFKSKTSTVDPLTCYHINREYIAALANLRTDLDSFSDNEAQGLMLSGYRMTEFYCPQNLLPTVPRGKVSWDFLRMDKTLKAETIDTDLMQQYKVGKELFFKVWRLSQPLKIMLVLLSLIVIGYLANWLSGNWSDEIFKITAGGLVTVLAVIIINRLGGKYILKLFRYKKTLKQIAIGLVGLVAGWNISLLHLHVFNPLFLSIGRKLNNVKRKH